MLALQRRGVTQIETISIELIGGLFMLLGVAPFFYLFVNIVTNPVIIEANRQGGGAVILALLDSLGIIVPVLFIGFGVFSFRLGLRLRRLDINAASWARQILLWLSFVGLFLLARTTLSALAEGQKVGDWLATFLPLALIEAVLVGSYWWLGYSADLFEGQEGLMTRSTRTAWNLLVPTMTILILVAARPLEQTFIASLTDRRFASGQQVNFVGLNNYAQLLGFRIDTIPCERDTGTGNCLTTENRQGQTETVYPRPRDYLGPEYTEWRYRELGGFEISGTRWVISARDRDFIGSILNTLAFTIFSVSLELILGLFIAMVVNSKFPGRGLMRAAMLVPWAVPTVISARLWEMMLRDNTSGIINSVFLGLGATRSQAFLANPDLQIPTMVAVDVWKTTPFMALILLAGLQVIPSDIYEAADVDGASRVRQFFRITLPLLRPTIAVALVFRTLDAIRVFDVFQVLLGRQKLSMAVYNYEMLVNNQQFGYASAVGVVIFLIILIFTVIYVRALGVTAE